MLGYLACFLAGILLTVPAMMFVRLRREYLDGQL